MHIQIKEFSGPLDLLLQLIRQEEMDIFDIDIHKITGQYLAFIEQNSITDLESAGDFIRMAALLIYIKSKSLFPSESSADSDDPENEEDPRKALERSLLKMQLTQRLSDQLNQYPLLNRDVWSAGEKDQDKEYSSLFSKPQETQIKKEPLLKLLRAYRRLCHKESSSSTALKPLALSLEESLPFLSDCIKNIQHSLAMGVKMNMSALIKKGHRNSLPHTLVTFLTLLELSRLGIVSLVQDKDFSDIAISVKRQFNDKDFHSIHKIEMEKSH